MVVFPRMTYSLVVAGAGGEPGCKPDSKDSFSLDFGIGTYTAGMESQAALTAAEESLVRARESAHNDAGSEPKVEAQDGEE